jgi:hypothetical protein
MAIANFQTRISNRFQIPGNTEFPNIGFTRSKLYVARKVEKAKHAQMLFSQQTDVWQTDVWQEAAL